MATNKATRPSYEALDLQGRPYLRPAQNIGELPTPEDRIQALAEATEDIATKTGLTAIDSIKLGMPVFGAFAGMNRPSAKQHSESALLLTIGHDLPLDYCRSYCAR